MKSPTSKTAIVIAGGLAASAALLVGCSSTSSSGGSSSSPSPTGKTLTAEQQTFCSAVTTFYTSSAAANAQTAASTGDAAQVMTAFAAWAPQAQALASSVPADASASVKQAYLDVSTAVTNTGAGTVTQAQKDALTAAKPVVIAYEKTTCP